MSDEFRELLFANVALLHGKAQVRDLAAALQRYWDRRHEGGVTVASELARLVDLDSGTLAAIHAEVERLAAAVGGLRPDGDGPRDATRPDPGPAAGAATPGDPPLRLREVQRDRYVDFMPVGEGGMGIVYWALDSDLKRQVAFKVVRPPVGGTDAGVTPPLPFALVTPETDTPDERAFRQLTARFLQEAWVTGGMEHPGIVPVYDLGRTGSGVPYYTMKFVRGSRTLRTAIEALGGQGIDERVELIEAFLKVCDTIRYAHSRGVIHRDLKPDNVALGEYGEVVVLDWGLARLTEQSETLQSRWQDDVKAFRESADLKTLPAAVGTPGYMAPEAAQGQVDRLDERGDVYSLGVMLFEILTGRRPFLFRTFPEYQEQVVREDAPDARTVVPDVPAALASVCRDALARDPAARTRDVGALAGAVRAWQGQRAVDREVEGLLREADAGLAAAADVTGAAMMKQADRAALACRRALELHPGHPDAAQRLDAAGQARERGIQVRERAARRRLLRVVGGGVLVVAALVGGIVAWILEERRQEAEGARAQAARAQRQAEADRVRAEGVMTFMVGEMQQSLEPLGRLDLLAKLGTAAKDYFETLPAAGISPASLRNGTVALRNLGAVYYEQGDLPAARKAHEAAVAAAEALQAAAKDDPDATALLSLARAQVARVLIAQGYPTHAVDLLTRHVEDVEAQARRQPEARDVKTARAEAHHLLGRAHLGRLALDEAMAGFDRAQELAQDLAEQDDASGSSSRLLVAILLSPTRALRLQSRLDEADARTRRALAIVRTWRERQPKDVRWRRLEADALWAVGQVDVSAERFESGLERYEAARAIYESLRSLDPANLGHLARIGNLELGLGHAVQALDEARWRDEMATRKAAGDATPVGRGERHFPHWRAAWLILSQLAEKDPSNARWLHAMITLCDRMSQVEADNPQALQGYRDAALGYARRLRACDFENVLWQHLYAYTLYQHALHHEAHEAERVAEELTEVVDVAHEIAPRHAAGLEELGVLQAMATSSLLPLQDGAAQRASLRRCIDFLVEACRKLPDSTQLSGTLHDQRKRLLERLAAGGPDEREAALDLVDAERARLQRLLDRGAGDEPRRERLRAWQRALDERGKALRSAGAVVPGGR